MAEQIIYLEPENDHVSIRDRLAWTEADRVLVVLPPADEPIRDRLGLVLLQRQANRMGIEIGLITTNPDIAIEARTLGIPIFPSIDMGRKERWQWPWKPTQEKRTVSAPSPPELQDLKEMHRRTRPRPAWQRRIGRLGGLILFIFTLITLGIGFVYIVPSATVVLRPESRELSVTSIIIGDPSIEAADYDLGLIPARLIRVEVDWRGAAATTGITDVPDAPASGTVIFINQQAEPVTIPAGTTVRTSAGTTIRFRTTQEVQVTGPRGATIETPIVAVDPGPWGNIDANLINRIDGALALQLNVRNLSPTAGGSMRQVKAVTQSDLDRLRDQVLQQLFQLAKAEMANWMTETEFLAEESLALFLVTGEDYNRYVGERADAVELEMSALIEGYVVDASLGFGVLYTALAAETPDGYYLLPDSITPPRRGEVLKVEPNGRVTYLMQAQARAAAVIDRGHVTEMIRGLGVDQAIDWLNRELPLQEKPAVRVWPTWFGRLPYLPIRITASVEVPE